MLEFLLGLQAASILNYRSADSNSDFDQIFAPCEKFKPCFKNTYHKAKKLQFFFAHIWLIKGYQNEIRKHSENTLFPKLI